jgi:two-component system, chemotaxis family, protein-glutamate methylesterase/glutaminase
MSSPEDIARSMREQHTALVVIGGSAGALQVLERILSALPNDFPALCVVLHSRGDGESLLARTLARWTRQPVKDAETQEKAKPGHVYVAPPDYHLLVEGDGTLTLTNDEAVCFSRPSIDVLFASAAEAFGARCIGILLSGANDDGAEGLRRIVAHGGIGLVQAPDTAEFARMPLAAIDKGGATAVFSPELLARVLALYGGAR